MSQYCCVTYIYELHVTFLRVSHKSNIFSFFIRAKKNHELKFRLKSHFFGFGANISFLVGTGWSILIEFKEINSEFKNGLIFYNLCSFHLKAVGSNSHNYC
jgi:hypothetical protein